MTIWNLKLGDVAIDYIKPLLVKPAYGAVPALPQQELGRLDIFDEGITEVGCDVLSSILVDNIFLKDNNPNHNPNPDPDPNPDHNR